MTRKQYIHPKSKHENSLNFFLYYFYFYVSFNETIYLNFHKTTTPLIISSRLKSCCCKQKFSGYTPPSPSVPLGPLWIINRGKKRNGRSNSFPSISHALKFKAAKINGGCSGAKGGTDFDLPKLQFSLCFLIPFVFALSIFL